MNYAGIAFVFVVMLFPGLAALVKVAICHFVLSDVSAKTYTVEVWKG